MKKIDLDSISDKETQFVDEAGVQACMPIIGTSPLSTIPSIKATLNIGQFTALPSSQTGSRLNEATCINSIEKPIETAFIEIDDFKMRLAGDVIVAFSVTFAVSPFTSIIDKAIVEQAAGRLTITSSLVKSISAMTRSPLAFLKSPTFLLMWSVYAATYTTANCLKTGMEHQESQKLRRHETLISNHTHNAERIRVPSGAHNTSHAMITLKPTYDSLKPILTQFELNKFNTFICTTVVNSGFSILRDKLYAQMFGNGSSRGIGPKFPLKTYGLWALRDGVVIGSSFVLPDLLGAVLHERHGINRADATKVTQMACPIASQFVAGPAQLLGLDYYNRPSATLRERGIMLMKNIPTVVAARIARIAPTYGIGGIGNTYFREKWRDYFSRQDIQKLRCV